MPVRTDGLVPFDKSGRLALIADGDPCCCPDGPPGCCFYEPRYDCETRSTKLCKRWSRFRFRVFGSHRYTFRQTAPILPYNGIFTCPPPSVPRCRSYTTVDLTWIVRCVPEVNAWTMEPESGGVDHTSSTYRFSDPGRGGAWRSADGQEILNQKSYANTSGGPPPAWVGEQTLDPFWGITFIRDIAIGLALSTNDGTSTAYQEAANLADHYTRSGAMWSGSDWSVGSYFDRMLRHPCAETINSDYGSAETSDWPSRYPCRGVDGSLPALMQNQYQGTASCQHSNFSLFIDQDATVCIADPNTGEFSNHVYGVVEGRTYAEVLIEPLDAEPSGCGTADDPTLYVGACYIGDGCEMRTARQCSDMGGVWINGTCGNDAAGTGQATGGCSGCR